MLMYEFSNAYHQNCLSHLAFFGTISLIYCSGFVYQLAPVLLHANFRVFFGATIVTISLLILIIDGANVLQ